MNRKDAIKQLIDITRKIALGHYKDALHLFEMTKKDSYPQNISELAEAFGLMLVRVEAREFHLKEFHLSGFAKTPSFSYLERSALT